MITVDHIITHMIIRIHEPRQRIMSHLIQLVIFNLDFVGIRYIATIR